MVSRVREGVRTLEDRLQFVDNLGYSSLVSKVQALESEGTKGRAVGLSGIQEHGEEVNKLQAGFTKAAAFFDAKRDKRETRGGCSWGPSTGLLCRPGVSGGARGLTCFLNFGRAGNEAGPDVYDDFKGVVGACDDEVGAFPRVRYGSGWFDKYAGPGFSRQEK